MRKLFTLLILIFLCSTGMTQERVASDAINTGIYAPQSVQTFNSLAPVQGLNMNAATINQNSGIFSVSNKIEKKVQKVNLKSLPETTINPLAPLQGGENVATAFVLTGSLPISSSGTTDGYIHDYDEACIYTGSLSPDVVYAYTPAANVVVDIDLCGSLYDTKVYVYENAATPGTPYACNDDFYTVTGDPCGQWVSKIEELSLTGGNTYYIVIDGYGGDFGDYNLEIREFTPPPACVWGVDIIPPVGAVAESEACGDDTNGGCNMVAPDIPTWEPVPSTGGTISGTMWADLATRDTDWFELVLTQASNVTLTANADQLIIYGYITGTFTPGAPDCPTVTSISPNNTAGPCNQTSLAVGVLAPGTYWFFVGMTVYEGFPCTNHYFITFSVVPESCPPPTALTVTNKTTTTADLGWTAGGTEIGWVAEVGLPGFAPGTGTHVFKDSPVVNYVTATGLSAGTPYQMYVQADCNGTSSAWAGPVNFTTNIECPGGAFNEAEVCGGTTNNSCVTPEPIALGQTVCGTSFYNGSTRDIDYYSFTLTQAQVVTLSGKADFDLQLLFVSSPCPGTVIAAGTALAGNTATVSTQLGPGTYFAWVGPQFTGVFACGDDNQYYATLSGAAITDYCTPAPTSVDNSGITNVTFSSVNNTTGAEIGNYGDYTAMIGDVQRTAIIPVFITFETGYTYDTKIWIDWNNDFFFDASEEVYSGTSLSTNPTTLEASFFVPANAPLGNHRMRIGGVDVGPPTPCYASSYGSFEDYTVNVLAAPACPAPSALTVMNILTNQADLGWTENGTATLWDIEVVEFGVTPTGVPTHPSVGTNPYTVTGLQAATHYEFYVRAKCAGNSDWSVAKDFSTSICEPVDQCNYTFRMTDSYGDGWNGNSMAVIQSGVTIQTISLAAGTGPEDVMIGLCHGVDFDLFWNSGGSWAGEVGIEILDPFGASVYYKAPGTGSQNTLLYTGTTNCTPPVFKTLNLTSVLLEGLYIGGGNMRMADDGTGNPQFPGYADQITVELHDAANYGTILHTATVLLSTGGAATVSDIPSALNGNYYITVKHRNSIETVSATAVSFAGTIINQSFGTPADVYGGNLQLMVDGYYAIFAGDVNQDDVVDTGDMTDVDNDSANYAAGYIPTDVTGDGTADTSDMTIVDNNSSNYVGSITPP